MPARSIRTITLNHAAAAALILCMVAATGSAQNDPRHAGLPNLHQVNDRLYRGAQPRKGTIKKLAEVGIKTVINLRGADDRTKDEETEAKAAGLAYFSIPLPGLGRPSDDEIARILAIIDAPENQPVFVHCKRGADRTGAVVAIYRITHDSWTVEQALAEANRHGMSWIVFSLRGYVSDAQLSARPVSGSAGFKDLVARRAEAALRAAQKANHKIKSSLARIF
jgi:protein tyrosine/serine phosphatase